MQAILLAAGTGRRLQQPFPKCLVDIGGMTLLSRALRALAAVEVIEAWVVLGYRHDLIAAELDRCPSPVPMICVRNEAYLRGSVRSLWAARQVMTDEVLVMDADVLFPVHLLRRLVQSPHRNCVLGDPRSSFTGEEMMLTVHDDRIWDITRGVRDASQVLGEGVGFYKLDRIAAHTLRRLLDEWIASGRDHEEYEEVFRVLFKTCAFGYELVGDLPWTEIDFPEDIVKAEQIVWPQIQAIETGLWEPR
jgi:L-glutamine-phosphate cytidylyltransferase